MPSEAKLSQVGPSSVYFRRHSDSSRAWGSRPGGGHQGVMSGRYFRVTYSKDTHIVRIMHPFRNCNRCAQTKPPEGGSQMHPARWVCFSCWKQISKGTDKFAVKAYLDCLN